MKRNGRLLLALESGSTGSRNREREITIYGRMVDRNQLAGAGSKVSQEQWEIKVPKTDENALGGRMRIRKETAKGGITTYTLTIKTKTAVEGTDCEVDSTSNELQFLMFQFLAEAGMIKDRYMFPVSGSDLEWHLDVYRDPKGGYYDWVRLELELPSEDDGKVELPSLPILLDEIILPPEYTEDQTDQSEKIEALYEEFFLTKNRRKETAIKTAERRAKAAKKREEKEAEEAEREEAAKKEAEASPMAGGVTPQQAAVIRQGDGEEGAPEAADQSGAKESPEATAEPEATDQPEA